MLDAAYPHKINLLTVVTGKHSCPLLDLDKPGQVSLRLIQLSSALIQHLKQIRITP